MPKIGEVKHGKDIGRLSTPFSNFIWHACEHCSQPRWVHYVNGIPTNKICIKCFNRSERTHHHPRWKGGRNKTPEGYIMIRIFPEDFFYPMCHARKGYITEHRYVMAKHIGRCLHSWEVVHHKNHIKDDNRIENLQLVSDTRHEQITILENKIARQDKRIVNLESRVTQLEAENAQLKVLELD